MDYVMTTLKEDFRIRKIVTVHYFEYTKDFNYNGEAHNFWEMVYVDKGVVCITGDGKSYMLKQGEITFHKPCEFHTLKANGKVAPNLVIISFECKSKAAAFFSGKIFKVSGQQKEYLSSIVKEAARAFSSPLSDPTLKMLVRSQEPTFGSEQIIKASLELLLISVHRDNFIKPDTGKSLSVLSERLDKNIVDDIINYMNENIHLKLKFDDFATLVSMSPTRLKTVFKQKTGYGVMQYFRYLKAERAKLFIRENDYNFSQIAQLLGYDSIHTFSRQFKAEFKMSPREYAKSVKIEL